MIFKMYFEQEFNLKEIGLEFRVTESRISQFLSVIKNKLDQLRDADLVSDLLALVGSDDARLYAQNVFIESIKDK